MSLFWLRFLTFLPHNIFFKIVSRAENLWKWRPESDLCQWFLLHVVCNVLQRLMTNAVWHRTCDELSEPINWYKEKPQFDQHLQPQAGSQRRKPVTIRFCVIHFNSRLISAFWFQRFGSDWSDLEETGDHMLLWQLEHPSAYLPTNPIVCLLGDSHTSSNTINEKLRRKRNLPLDPSLPSHPEKLCQENHIRKSRQGNVDVEAPDWSVSFVALPQPSAGTLVWSYMITVWRCKRPPQGGVPQGSVLCPPLFPVYHSIQCNLKIDNVLCPEGILAAHRSTVTLMMLRCDSWESRLLHNDHYATAVSSFLELFRLFKRLQQCFFLHNCIK